MDLFYILRRKFRNSIKFQFFIYIMAFSILTICLVSWFLYYSAATKITAIERKNILDKTKIVTANINKSLEIMNDMSTSFILNKTIRDSLTSSDVPISYEWFEELKRIEGILNSVNSNNDLGLAITIVGPHNKIFSDPSIGGVIPDSNRELIQTFEDKKVDRLYLVNNKSNPPVVTYLRKIIDNREEIGVITIDITINRLLNAIDSFESSFYHLSLLDNDGNFIYNSNFDILNNENYPILKKAIDSGKSDLIKINGQTYLVVSDKNLASGWVLNVLIPEAVILQGTVKFRFEALLLIIFVFIECFVLANLISKKSTENIKKLSDAVNMLDPNTMQLNSVIETEDETGLIQEVMRKMSNRIELLIGENFKKEEQKRKSEFKTLHAQINPHMIYNALNTITYLAQLQEIHNIEEISASLVKLLRVISHTEQEFILIDEELNYIENYVSIKKYALAHKFEIIYDIDVKCRQEEILKLLLLTMVENSIIHGFDNIDRDGLIKVKITKQDGLVRIFILDNGRGFNNLKLFDSSVKTENEFILNGIGIKNSLERLKLYYGEQSGIRIRSEQDKFTEIEIWYPIKDEENV